jgi:molybdenum cofactor cytidylyltransferase
VTGLYALVLAAGLGSRFGGGKLLAPWRGGVLLDGALAAALDSPAEAVLLITGAEGPAVAAAGRALAERRGQGGRLRCLLNADHAQGLSTSLKAGLAALPDEAAGVLVFLGDMPLVPPGLADRLAAALASGALAAAPVSQGRRGNPVAVSRALFPALWAISGDQGARPVLDTLGDRLVLIATDDDGVLLDVDRPEDLPP